MQGGVDSILGAIGNTPLVKLNQTASEVEANLYVKCEFLNPGGSMKDRMALNMVNQAELRGELKPGGTIIEATSGNTGAALAMIAAVRGYKCIFVMPDKMSEEKVASLRAFGATVIVCPTAVEPEDPRSYYSVAKRLDEETPNSFYTSQYHNQDNPNGHYISTGPEIWKQTQGDFEALIAGLGTGGTITGTGRYLKEQDASIKLVGVDPVGSLYYDYVKTGKVTQAFTYKVEGIGEDFFPSTIDLDILDDIVRVDDKECFTTTRSLVRHEGLYVGGSSGAAVAGAIKYAKQTQTKGNLVVIICDSAAKYLSKIFNDDWMAEHGFLGEDTLGTVANMVAGTPQTVISILPTQTVKEAVGLMKVQGIGGLPVIERDAHGLQHIKGVVTELDILAHLTEKPGALDAPVIEISSENYATVTSQTKVELLKSVFSHSRMALVQDKGQLTHVLTKIDLIDYLAARQLRG